MQKGGPLVGMAVFYHHIYSISEHYYNLNNYNDCVILCLMTSAFKKKGLYKVSSKLNISSKGFYIWLTTY